MADETLTLLQYETILSKQTEYEMCLSFQEMAKLLNNIIFTPFNVCFWDYLKIQREQDPCDIFTKIKMFEQPLLDTLYLAKWPPSKHKTFLSKKENSS